MKSRHIWVIFAFVMGVAAFAGVFEEHGLMWNAYTVAKALEQAALCTALILFAIAIALPFMGES